MSAISCWLDTGEFESKPGEIIPSFSRKAPMVLSKNANVPRKLNVLCGR
jgi:hypothetical protein